MDGIDWTYWILVILALVGPFIGVWIGYAWGREDARERGGD